ncbi:MAG: preprotein translocase subunit SecY [Candidatus Nezhaarchaeota archaeon]|nr:preprotein translocase subunit SecY [Candidatus Nezhaarchaeota archaeon]
MVDVRSIMEKVSSFVPRVQKPIKKVSFGERIVWTAIVLTIFLVMGQVPLYGIPRESQPFQELTIYNIVFAARTGTLLELGVGPIVTAGLIMQILVGTRIIRLDLTNPSDRALFTSSQKILTVIVTAVEAIAVALAYRFVGTMLTVVLVFVQLFVATLILMLLDELIGKGWGIGSGISLFIATGVAQHIFWFCFSPAPVREDGGPLGVFPALISYAIGGGDIWSVIIGSPKAPQLPTLIGFITMVIMIITIIYLESMRVEVPIAYSKYGGLKAKIPLKLLYVTNIPVIFFGVVGANFHLLANLTHNPFIIGMSHAFSAPLGFIDTIQRPLHALAYTLLICSMSGLLALAWVEASGMSARTQAENIVRSGLQIPGFRSAPSVVERYLARYIQTLTWVSGVMVGMIAALGDIFGVLGGGIGILLLIGILYQYYQIMARERALEMYPALKQFLGIER